MSLIIGIQSSPKATSTVVAIWPTRTSWRSEASGLSLR